MVNYELLVENPLARQAMSLLVESGVLVEMKKQLLDGLASGDSAESDEILNKSIREYRMDLTVVSSLIEVGERIKRKENEDEPR